ncbi:Uncharacterised protein [Budvicia aquatica]|nr:Uncharacterised protein [Budvicia aquatica]
MNLFKVSEKVAKLLIYSLIYSLGDVKKNKESKAFNQLCHIDGYDRAVEIADAWREFTTPIEKKLKQLVDIYIGQSVNCPGRGLAIRNAVRQTYMINPKKQKITAKNLRQILSHMIQGIESQAVYETILDNPGVCGSIEHDGLVSTQPLDWAHPYLRLKLKHYQ